MNHPISILYLEDSPRDVELAREQLQSGGLVCELRIASGRAEYEAALADTRFDLILSDFALPDYDGMSALVLAQAKQPAVPFILISGTLGEEQAVDCMLRGATDYVMKQRLHRLVPAVTRALAEAAEQQQHQAAEAALRESNDLFALFLQHSPIYAFIKTVTSAESRVVQASDSFQEMIGIAAGDMVGRTMAELFPADRAAKMTADDWAVVSSGKVLKLDEDLNGRNYSTIKFPIVREGRTLLAGYTIDITERKQAEAAQLANQERFHHLFQQIASVAIQGYAPDGTTLYWNAASEHLYGYSAIEAIGRNLLDLVIPPEMQTGVKAAMRQMAETGQPIPPGELSLMRKDGSRVTVFSSHAILQSPGHPQELFCIDIDLTARKQAEAELQLQGSALNAAANAIVITDPKGDVLWANPAFTKLTGYEVSEVLGKNLRVLKSGQHDAVFYRQMWETICAGLVWSGEIVNKRKDGRLYTEEMTITPVATDAGVITHYIAIKQDITARKLVKHALEASNRQLVLAAAELGVAQQQIVQQASLRALGQMASGIAHDFNNALSPIVGFSELLLKHSEMLADREKATQFLRHINTAGHDAADVVRRLREFGRQRVAGEISEAIDLPGLVRQIIEMTQPRWRTQVQSAGVTIQIATDLGKVPVIAGEEFAIREMLTNLIFNAVDALPAGGTITLGTAMDGEFVRVWVSDTGTGMTEEVRQRCFEPFFTTKDDKGTGLGLAMVYGIVQRHGGTAEVASQLGWGTTVTIRLPLKLPDPVASGTSESVCVKKLRVLVVDNDPMLREIVDALLTDDGHRVATAESGAAALQRLQSLPFDLVITDQAMPNMSGEQLAAAIHAVDSNLPVILMTGFGDLMKAAGEMPPHIRAILSKPITEAALRATLVKVFPGK